MRPGRARAYRQSGLSLVELMIAMVLGLIIVAAVYNTWMGSSRSARFTEGLQTMQENGRYGVSVLQRGLRLAGYSPAQNTAFSPIDIANSSDTQVVVTLRQAFDCNGRSTADRDGVAVNVYAYEAVPGRITCTGDSPAAVAMSIVDDVEGFRVLYGLDEVGGDDGQGDDVPERYVRHDEVGAAGETRIAAVRFALLVTSGSPIRRADRAEDHVLLDQVVPKNDRMARAVFTSTVKLRNRRSGS